MNNSVALYIRLSSSDENKKEMSESITNQKSLLTQYAKENNLNVYDIYIDEGYSGTNFDRPGFQRLINDIELKKINMVITKDMSRLGRDYIKTGELIEKYFPEHNIRYIAVTDNIDTYLDNSNNDIAPFKAIMNDMYAKDISKKIKSSLRAKQKEGKWVGGRAPFGYAVDPKNKNHLIINKKQSNVVKKIFNMSLNGFSFFKIAKELTTTNELTPAMYYNFKWKNNYNIKYGIWHAKTIRDILTNEMYCGNMIQNKRTKVNYKIKKIVKNDPNNYIIVNNTHQAIIDKKIFNEVQKNIPKNVGRNEKKEEYLLDGLLYCGNCGHRISVGPRRKKDNRCYTICNYYRTYLKQKLCTPHSNNYDNLESIIIDILRCKCLKHMNKEKIKDVVLNSKQYLYKDNYENKISILKTEINKIKDNIDNTYIDKLNNVIDEDIFNGVKLKLQQELFDKKKKYDKLKNIINNVENNISSIEECISEWLELKTFSRKLIISLVDRIEIYDDKRINIILAFNNKKE